MEACIGPATKPGSSRQTAIPQESFPRPCAQDKSWDDWLTRTGELPPDFDAMPSVPGLPEIPPLTGEAWQRERRRIRGLFEQWVYGHIPPPPDNLQADVTASHQEGGVTVREVLDRTIALRFTCSS